MSISDEFGDAVTGTFGGTDELITIAESGLGGGGGGIAGAIVGDAVTTGLTESGLGDVLDDTGFGAGNAIDGIDDLVSGDYADAAADATATGLDLAGEAIGVPGIDGDTQVLDDLFDGNTGAIAGDAEKAAIETGTSIALGAVGSIIGPEGTIVGAAIGDFVGSAIAPSVEDAVSDTWDTATDVVDDSVNAFEDAGDDLSDGDVFGAVGDVAGGVVDDVGDLATGAVDLVGDAAECVDALVTDTADVVTSAADDVEDVVSSAADDVEDVASSAVDDVEDFFDSL